MDIPALAGYAWIDRWHPSGEGPYTLLGKLMQANGLKPAQARTIAKPSADGGIDLLRPLPSRHGPEAHRVWGDLLQAASVSRMAPGIYSHLAGAEHFRYCSICIRRGFQAAVCQISGIQCCPLHKAPERLWTSCQHCHAPTPRYFVYDTPPTTTCPQCQVPYGGLGTGDKAMTRWASPRNLERLQPIHDWLAKVSDPARLCWTNLASWVCASLKDLEQPSIRRLAVFQVLQRLVSGPLLPGGKLPIDILGPFPAQLHIHDQTPASLTAAEYVPIASRLFGKPGSVPKTSAKYFRLPNNGVPISIQRCSVVGLQAILFWRAQHEPAWDSDPLALDPSTKLTYDSGWRMLPGSRETLTVDPALRNAYLLASWVAAQRLAKAWSASLPHWPRGATDASMFSAWFNKYALAAQRLGVWAKEGVSPVGVVVMRGDSPGTALVYFAIA